MRHRGMLAALAAVIAAGLVPAMALSPAAAGAAPGSARVAAAARTAGVPGGTLLWSAGYRGRFRGNSPAAMAASPDGTTVYVTGSTEHLVGTTAHALIATVAYNAASGAQTWAASFYGRGFSQSRAIAVSPDGTKVFVTGYTASPGGHDPQFVTVAYNAATGAQIWARRPFAATYAGSSGTSIAVSPDGTTVFAGGGAGENPVLVAYDAATGAQRWLARYQVPRTDGGEPPSMAVSPDGSMVFLTGSFTAPPDGSEFATIAYNAATGAQIWAQTAHGSATSNTVVSPDGSAVFVSGAVQDSATLSAVTTVAYAAATGARLWSRRYHSSPDSEDRINALAVSPDGSRLYLTGESSGPNPHPTEYATVAYDAATGATLWTRYYQPSAIPGATAIGASPDGTLVFVTGTSNGTGADKVNYITIAYDAATGQTAWLARYQGPSDYAGGGALAVSPDGQAVFVTGSIKVQGVCCDYGTVAYQP